MPGKSVPGILPVTRPTAAYRDEILQDLGTILDSRILTNFGPAEEAFREELEKRTGLFCQPVSSGDMALYLSLLTLRDEPEYGMPGRRHPRCAGRAGSRQTDIRKEQRKDRTGEDGKGFGGIPEVITTPFTFPSTTEAILRAGMRPVFSDVDPDTGCLDPDGIEEKITGNTVGIVPVEVYGNPVNPRITSIAEEYHLFVLVDGAHAFGEEKEGRPLFETGTLHTVSFHATKALHTIEGGAVFGRDRDLIEKVRRLSNFGIQDAETVTVPGCNGKMNELEAAVGLVNLKHFPEDTKKRQKVQSWYAESLGRAESGSRSSGTHWEKTKIPGIRMRVLDARTRGNGAYCPVLVTGEAGMDRDALYDFLYERGIHARKYFYPLVTAHPVIRRAAGLPGSASGKEAKEESRRETPIAASLAEKVLCLPCYPDLTQADVRRVVEAIREAETGNPVSADGNTKGGDVKTE